MVLPVLRPMTIAAATGLVAGGAFSSYTTVYADEYDEQSSRHPDGYRNDRRDNRHPSGFDSYDHYKRRFSNTHTLMAQEDELLPGLIYVGLAGLTGSLVARQRNILIRMFSPLAFATAAGAYFLPHATHNVFDSIGGPMTSARDSVHEHTHKAQHWVDGKVRDAGEAMDDLRGEANRPHMSSSGWFHTHKDEVEDQAEGKVKEAKDWVNKKSAEADKTMRELSDKSAEATKEVKHWWSSTSSKVEDAANKAKDAAEKGRDTARDASSWFSTKADEAEKAVGDATHKAKDWVDDKTAVAEQKLDASAKEADEWWKTHAAEEEKRAAEKKAHDRKEAEKEWFHRQRTGKEHPEHSEHSKWWSSRYNPAGAIVGAGVGLDSADHHPPAHHPPTHHKPRGKFPSDPSLTHHYNHPHHNSFLGYASDFGTDGALDDEDVDEHDVNLAVGPSTATRKVKRQFPSDPSLTHHYNHPHHNSFLGYASDFGTDGALDDEDVDEHDVNLAVGPSTATRKVKRQFPSDPSLTHHYNHPHHNSFLGYASDFGTDGALDDEDVDEHDVNLAVGPSTATRKVKRQFPSDPSLTHHYNHPHHNSFLGYASDFGTD
ncbi:hypothetical protein BG000_002658, partial [Podila horticola]